MKVRFPLRKAAAMAVFAAFLWSGAASAAPAIPPGGAGWFAESPGRLDLRTASAFFRDLFGAPPLVARPGFAMFRINDTTDARDPHHAVVTVTQLPGELAVRFSIHDNHCVDWVREFMEGPFFTPEESEALYALLPETLGERVAVVGRFHAVARCEPAPGGRRLTLRFLSPSIR